MKLTDIIELELALSLLELEATVTETVEPDTSTLTGNPLLDY